MIITPETFAFLTTAYSACFNKGFTGAPTNVPKIALEASSATAQEIYAWMGQFPGMREWVGDRHIKNLNAYDYFIKNEKFESTVAIPREKLEDDMYGVYAPMMEQMGRVAKVHPDQKLFYLLNNGFTIDCYDGQPFFDTDHPGFGPGGVPISVSNMLPAVGAPGPAWFLLDTKQPVKPLVWQTRVPYTFTTIMKDDDRGVFLRDEYLFGIRARVNAGFGFWQCAYGSLQPLTAGTFAAARVAMATLRGDQGQILGIEGNTLVCGPSNEAAARLLLKATSVDATSNIWHEAAELIVTPYLD